MKKEYTDKEYLDLDLKLDQASDKLSGFLFYSQVVTVREAYSLEIATKKFLKKYLEKK